MFHVYHSDKAEKQQPIFFCRVKKGDVKTVVKATHAFPNENLMAEFVALQLNYLGEFICYATIYEWSTASGEKLPIPDVVVKNKANIKPHNWGADQQEEEPEEEEPEEEEEEPEEEEPEEEVMEEVE